MKKMVNPEISITLTKDEWCDILVDLKRSLGGRKKDLENYEGLVRILKENSAADPEDEDSVKRWKISIDIAERIIKKIESSI